jgi:hypothetical protein
MSTSGGLLIYSDLLILVYGPLGEVMAWFMLLGGLFSALGSLTFRWAGEFTGLPLLGSAFCVFGILVWRVNHEQAPLIAAANLCLLLSIGVVMGARWRVVFAVYHLASALGKGKSGE